MKFSKLSKVASLVLAAAMALSLAACSVKGDKQGKAAGGSADLEALMSAEPKQAEEAAELHKKLMQKENDILSSDSELWEKVFMAADKDTPMIEDGSNYSDFLLATIESAKDKFSAEELKKLKAGAEQIKEIEGKLTILEQKYPGCGSQPAEGDSVDASQAGMAGKTDELTKFPSFEGQDLDGKPVSSQELFSSNRVTVVNFWFTTCKPCVEELEDLEALNKQLAEKSGAVVGINSFTLDGDQTAIAEAKDVLSKKGISYPNIWFKRDSEAGTLTSGLYSYPTTYVVDQDGNIVGQPITGGITSPERAKELNDLIDRALADKK